MTISATKEYKPTLRAAGDLAAALERVGAELASPGDLNSVSYSRDLADGSHEYDRYETLRVLDGFCQLGGGSFSQAITTWDGEERDSWLSVQIEAHESVLRITVRADRGSSVTKAHAILAEELGLVEQEDLLARYKSTNAALLKALTPVEKPKAIKAVPTTVARAVPVAESDSKERQSHIVGRYGVVGPVLAFLGTALTLWVTQCRK